MKSLSGRLVDIPNRTIRNAVIHIEGGKIRAIEHADTVDPVYLCPGFVDAHIHIESSMLLPYEFARIALTHGTVATISDPHEIANVCGVEGVEYMLENARNAKLKFHFGAPSCVPATGFETAGATIGPEAVDALLARADIHYLSEVMNFPGVLNGQEDVMQKIAAAKKHFKPIDGHAPGLRGETAGRYISNGISTDHECFTLEEALDKLSYGMKILIREGSAARNFEALHPLLGSHPGMCMLCSDDMHPDELLLGHINRLVARAVALGYDLFDVLYAACIHPVEHYRMQNGLLRIGDPADFVVLENLNDFRVKQTYIDGECVASDGTCVLPPTKHSCINRFKERIVSESEFSVKDQQKPLRIIEARDGQLITGEIHDRPKTEGGFLVADTERDLLKIAVVNRYADANVAVGFIRNFGLRSGAIASTVAHDSHNIIVTGTSDREIAHAVNLLMKHQGGLCVVNNGEEHVLPLPIAGLMSDRDAGFVGPQYAKLDAMAKKLGSELRAPFMTLSFMALLVIPQLKLSDLGLFDGATFRFCKLDIE